MTKEKLTSLLDHIKQNTRFLSSIPPSYFSEICKIFEDIEKERDAAREEGRKEGFKAARERKPYTLATAIGDYQASADKYPDYEFWLKEREQK